jgi:cytochrome c oxidase subunit 2
MPCRLSLAEMASACSRTVMRRFLPALPALPVLAGCRGIQSTLDPQGPDAQSIAAIGWVLFTGGTLIFLLVVALTAWSLWAHPAKRAWLTRHGLIVGGGVVFPVVALSALLIYSFTAARDIVGRKEPASLRIEVVGERWWWRVTYLDGNGKPQAATANEIHIPTGRSVELTLKSADVIHSFWAPNLTGKLDMIPGHVNTLRLQADTPGTYRGQCAEYCGAQHANMAFFVVAETPQAFDAWLVRQSALADEPRTPFLQAGKELFLSQDCVDCHTVRGATVKVRQERALAKIDDCPMAQDVLADGSFGPDLTHIGGRLSIAAGTLANNAGTLAGWIASSQDLKPGNCMPSSDEFTGEELRALAGYLESLK